MYSSESLFERTAFRPGFHPLEPFSSDYGERDALASPRFIRGRSQVGPQVRIPAKPTAGSGRSRPGVPEHADHRVGFEGQWRVDHLEVLSSPPLVES